MGRFGTTSLAWPVWRGRFDMKNDYSVKDGYFTDFGSAIAGLVQAQLGLLEEEKYSSINKFYFSIFSTIVFFYRIWLFTSKGIIVSSRLKYKKKKYFRNILYDTLL